MASLQKFAWQQQYKVKHLQCDLLAPWPVLLIVQMWRLTVIANMSFNSVSEGVPPWDICAVMNDIRSMASSRGLAFKWCPRVGNRAAHWVASACLHDTLPVNWVSQPPMAFVGCL